MNEENGLRCSLEYHFDMLYIFYVPWKKNLKPFLIIFAFLQKENQF